MYYKTKLDPRQEELRELYAKWDSELEYIFYGRRGRSGIYQGIVPDYKIGLPGELHCSFIKIKAGCGVRAHSDTRACGLNYPVYIPEGSYNTFHDAGDGKPVDMAYRGKQRSSSAQLFLRNKEVDRFMLDRPTLLNTHQPHAVTEGDTERVVLSVSFEEEWDYERVKQWLVSNNY